MIDLHKFRTCGIDVRIADTVIIKYPELVSIGDHVAIDEFFYSTTSLNIGSYVHIGPFCSIIGGRQASCSLEDFTGLSAGCRIVCSTDDYLGSGLTNPTIPSKYRAEVRVGEVILKKHVVLGTNCVIHPGITIGEGTAVGSCSLVAGDISPWSVYVGVPARRLKDRPSERILLMEKHLREGI